MRKFSKILFLSAILCSGVLPVQADDLGIQGRRGGDMDNSVSINPIFVNKPQVILFKIHDIKPVTDTEGNVTACEYTATFYNRTPVNIRQAKIQLGWSDHISELYPIGGEFTAEKNLTTEQNSEPEEVKEPEVQKQIALNENLGTFQSTLNIPALASLKQISIQGVVKTDKCFALFDNIKFNVPMCNILTQEAPVETRRGRLDADKDLLNCAALFAYVNSKHPEYYSEFRKISYEEQVQQERTQEEKEKEMIQTIGNNIQKNFKDTDYILDAIK